MKITITGNCHIRLKFYERLATSKQSGASFTPETGRMDFVRSYLPYIAVVCSSLMNPESHILSLEHIKSTYCFRDHQYLSLRLPSASLSPAIRESIDFLREIISWKDLKKKINEQKPQKTILKYLRWLAIFNPACSSCALFRISWEITQLTDKKI